MNKYCQKCGILLIKEEVKQKIQTKTQPDSLEILAIKMEAEWKSYIRDREAIPFPSFFNILDEILEQCLGRKVNIR